MDVVWLEGRVRARLVRGYEADPERRQDLLQDIHIALWRSWYSTSAVRYEPGSIELRTSRGGVGFDGQSPRA